ncbi:ATP synthase gamma chain [Alphaproteobacteria bacterium]|nr:ATP synthase gamma chain [Alphaproteobacteria bacterium]GHS95896.1 ATP synthase gamma chain [Alphaproteobacteria bacterium]
MANLKEIRKRIRSIESTHKLTSAMKLIAASRLKHSQRLLSLARRYEASLQEALAEAFRPLTEEAFESFKEQLPAFFSKKKDSSPPVICVLGAQKGLCGSYHYAAIREALALEKLLKKQQKGPLSEHLEKEKEETKENSEEISEEEDSENLEESSVFKKKKNANDPIFIPLTTKTAEFFSKNKPDQTEPLAGLGHFEKEAPVMDIAQYIWEHIENWFDKDEVGSVSLVSGKFVNAMTQKTQSFDLFPLWDYTHPFLKKPLAKGENAAAPKRQTPEEKPPEEKTPETSAPSPPEGEPLVEPSLFRVLEESARHLVLVKICLCLLESETCENAARVMTMDKSKHNAEELLQKLKLKYNQTRQMNITNELMEIIAGTSALEAD